MERCRMGAYDFLNDLRNAIKRINPTEDLRKCYVYRIVSLASYGPNRNASPNAGWVGFLTISTHIREICRI